MATLNRIPAAVARRHGVRAATDITGFGLAGHTANVARESHLTIEIRLADLPCSRARASSPRATSRPASKRTAGSSSPRRGLGGGGRGARALAYDPQTSGGLLLLVPEAAADALLADLSSPAPSAARFRRAPSPRLRLGTRDNLRRFSRIEAPPRGPKAQDGSALDPSSGRSPMKSCLAPPARRGVDEGRRRVRAPLRPRLLDVALEKGDTACARTSTTWAGSTSSTRSFGRCSSIPPCPPRRRPA
jgi:hypothetical protein